ncbi:MAG TPA: ATP-binding protein [Beijerinckiaceae bacterium]|nr:ATP-binding protein [Beijerinckiaceae bacterium]
MIEANQASEHFFDLSRALLARRSLSDLVPAGSPLLALIEQVRQRNAGITEYAVDLVTQRAIAERLTGERLLDLYASPVANRAGHVIVVLQERSMADKMTRQLTHRGAARSVSAMSAMLAHEIKNPLSGIRGAAQLLEIDADDTARELTGLIRAEVDRIVRLVDRFEVFADGAPAPFAPINIHEVLDHVIRLAASGFARDIRVTKDYDPSLPPVFGNGDQLVQVMLNLIKNAAEAIHDFREDGEITVSTAYRPGVRVLVPSSGERISLPLEVCVVDNGPGIRESLIEHLFEPFVTTKASGTGLGLATVAKIVSDHGGVVECERVKRGTMFRILLPLHRPAAVRREAGSRTDAE